MKRLICLSAVLVVISFAAKNAGADEKAAAIQAFKDYVAAVGTLDAQRVAPYYHEPLMFVTSARAGALATRAEIEAWLKPVFTRLRERGYARSDWSEFQAKLLSNGVAVVSTQTVRYKTDGQQLEKVGFTYVLRKTNDGWKVAVLVGHDPTNVLRLD
jgi:ketosteroid isomerase-like protein